MDPDTIQELFKVFGPVKVRRMFGGAGLYADAATARVFEREGCGPFEYHANAGKRAVMSYWQLPDRLYDEPGGLAEWARTALAVAQSSAAAKPKTRRESVSLRNRNVRRPAGRRRR